jgi:hypothetical protein
MEVMTVLSKKLFPAGEEFIAILAEIPAIHQRRHRVTEDRNPRKESKGMTWP